MKVDVYVPPIAYKTVARFFPNLVCNVSIPIGCVGDSSGIQVFLNSRPWHPELEVALELCQHNLIGRIAFRLSGSLFSLTRIVSRVD